MKLTQETQYAMLDALRYITGWKPADWSAETARDMANRALSMADRDFTALQTDRAIAALARQPRHECTASE